MTRGGRTHLYMYDVYERSRLRWKKSSITTESDSVIYLSILVYRDLGGLSPPGVEVTAEGHGARTHSRGAADQREEFVGRDVQTDHVHWELQLS